MAIEQTRARVISSIWQAIAQSGVDLSGVSQDEQQKLVGKIADSVLVTMNAILDEESPKVGAVESTAGEQSEQILWEGHPFLSMVESYQITTERVKVRRGLLARDIENYELIRMQDLDLSQGMSERMLGIGDISIRGQDPSEPILVLRNISKPEEVYELLRKAWLEARKRYGLQFREYM
jgi:hypothetical protein